jgi:2-dehydropantoate 2-reductase
MSAQRIALVGVGAIGGSVIADIADLAKHEIVLCSRTPFDTLVVEHPEGTSRVQARVSTDPADVGPVDWILLAVKAHQSAQARPWLNRLSGPGTRVAVLQNGVDHVERIAPLVAPDVDVVPVVIQMPAERTAPGRIVQGNTGVLFVPDDAPGRAFVSLFEGGRTKVIASEQFVTQAWWKLLSNAALGGVCALTIRDTTVVQDAEIRELVLRLMREVMAVGRAEGADLPDDAPEKTIERVLAAASGHWSSITVDRREGRPLEWRARNEVVGRRAREHGIEVPLNDLVTLLLRAADPAV